MVTISFLALAAACVICLSIGAIIGFITCAIISVSKMSNEPLTPLTEEELYGSMELPTHARFDKKA